ncbi:unnamed protein product [Colias eurytheme]|nr:unnamed protein product [Colias eurytheme]
MRTFHLIRKLAVDTPKHNTVQPGVFRLLRICPGEPVNPDISSLSPVDLRPYYVCAVWILYGAFGYNFHNHINGDILRALPDGDQAAPIQAPQFQGSSSLRGLHLGVLFGTYYTTLDGVGELC